MKIGFDLDKERGALHPSSHVGAHGALLAPGERDWFSVFGKIKTMKHEWLPRLYPAPPPPRIWKKQTKLMCSEERVYVGYKTANKQIRLVAQ